MSGRVREAATSARAATEGHPPGLYVLFFTEMWERMSYYGMRALLVLYMTDYLFVRPDIGRRVFGYDALKHGLELIFGPLAAQPLASQIYGLYTGLVYLTPVLGGLLADRVLGQRKSVIIGCVIMALGHFLMAVEALFFPALLCLIIGNGAFKPNVSTQVGLLYEDNDPRRDRAFAIFYVGVNVGSFLSPLICGTLGQKYGWHWGFGAAGVGMLLGLFIYAVFGKKYLPASFDTPAVDRPARGGARATTASAGLTEKERGAVLALVVLCALNVVFWAVYEQQGNTMQLWADKNTHWPTIFGWQVPSTWFQSFNPAMLIAFTPLTNLVWAWQAKRDREPSSVMKMAIGCFLLGASFVVMIIGVRGIQGDVKGSLLWPFFCTAMLTAGELYLSPVGLSLVTKIAPARMVSLMMGVWYMSSFFGNYLSGLIGTLWDRWPKELFFLLLTALGLSAGAAIYAINRWLNRMMGEHAT